MQTAQHVNAAEVPDATAQAPIADLLQVASYSAEETDSVEAVGQVTSVSQLSDVKPTDWA